MSTDIQGAIQMGEALIEEYRKMLKTAPTPEKANLVRQLIKNKQEQIAIMRGLARPIEKGGINGQET
jgi:hypothetical protein